MFGKKKEALTNEKDEKIKELEQEIAELRARLDVSETELEAVNTSTHLGIWKCFFDEKGNQEKVI